jgi:hypothetical protein
MRTGSGRTGSGRMRPGPTRCPEQSKSRTAWTVSSGGDSGRSRSPIRCGTIWPPWSGGPGRRRTERTASRLQVRLAARIRRTRLLVSATMRCPGNPAARRRGWRGPRSQPGSGLTAERRTGPGFQLNCLGDKLQGRVSVTGLGYHDRLRAAIARRRRGELDPVAMIP